jgi:rod shape-determining protein MreC
VKRFENKEITGEAIIEPAVDFSTIEHVFVIEMQSVVMTESSSEVPAAIPVKP